MDINNVFIFDLSKQTIDLMFRVYWFFQNLEINYFTIKIWICGVCLSQKFYCLELIINIF